ncbi:MAPEG family protein [Devosia rhizoryzae]|uniref:MAPEG family protein n=1 Tax=Devosia rhizoryzae TaxID=2774137 RepID=A0ABX7CCT6_9HYPH|nr:MAPEG family protein [Devosia rhizoryzae]QQR39776.1 MAPEG family protein [Devosia rhizoryzae]
MTVELTYVIWSAFLGLVYLGVQAMLFRLDFGFRYANTQRDIDPPPPNKWNKRGQRALANFLETYGVFLALALATELSGRSDNLTVWGAHIWFWARIAFLPAYFIDINQLRSSVWTISLIGLLLMFIGVAF